MISKLPDAFLMRMRQMLGKESKDFFDSLKKEDSIKGLRVNTLKLTSDDFLKQAPWYMEPVAWIKNAFFCPEDVMPASNLMYKAGLYYIQEPSAMTPADRLPVEPGDRVLDLCAAPGGKATALAAKLEGKGLLVANEVSTARAKALLYNMEVFGAANALITNELPKDLEKRFPGYFDKILVDAPCSGEGMFRKEEQAALMWSEEKVSKCAQIQKGILENAVHMLKEGGMLMYSTCTFSQEENENNVCFLLEKYPDLHLQSIEGYEGFAEGIPVGSIYDEELKKTVRIWPHKMRGEGHFLALFKKEGTGEVTAEHQKYLQKTGVNKEDKHYIDDFFEGSLFGPDFERVDIRGGRVYMVPLLPKTAKGVRFLRNGLYLGDLKKKRFEPSQALALALTSRTYRYSIDIMSDEDAQKALAEGGNIRSGQAADYPEKSWILITAGGYGLAWSKKNGEILKNKYLWKNK